MWIQPSSLKVIACIIARCDSSRLPLKHFYPIGKLSTLDHIVLSLSQCSSNIIPIITTSDRLVDRPLLDYALNHSIHSYAGSFSSPLDRLYNLNRLYKPDLILKINGDSPFISYELTDLLVHQYIQTQSPLITAKGQYIDLPIGLGPEAISPEMINLLFSKSPPHLHESVTGLAFQDADTLSSMVSILEHPFPKLKIGYSSCTLDTPQDLIRLRHIVNLLPGAQPPYRLQSLLPLLVNCAH